MNIVAAAFLFILGGVSVIAFELLSVRSFFDEIREFLQTLFG